MIEFEDGLKKIKLQKTDVKYYDSQVLEFSLKDPSFHFDFNYPSREIIDGGIYFKPIVSNLVSKYRNKSKQIKVVDDSNILVYSYNNDCKIVGDKNIKFRMKSSILKVECFDGSIYFICSDFFISYDLNQFRIWDIDVVDLCFNNMKELILLVGRKEIHIYKSNTLLDKFFLDEECTFIESYVGRQVIVYTKSYSIFLIDLISGKVKTIHTTPKLFAYSIKVYKNYLVMHTYTSLIIIDIINKTRQFVKAEPFIKYHIDNYLLRVWYKRSAFKYYDIKDIRNNKSVIYDEICQDFDVFKGKIYVILKKSIAIFDGKNRSDIEIESRNNIFRNFANSIFTNIDFERYRTKYDNVKKETAEFFPNEMNALLEEDLERILNKDKKAEVVDNSFKITVNKKKSKRGGF